jgi:hypothetical protein
MAVLGAIGGCESQHESLYQNVNANSRWSERDMISREYSTDDSVPSYLIVNNELYLNVQNVKQRFLYTEVEHPSWDKDRILELERKDPEFASHLPNTVDPYGGIKWLREQPHRAAN